MTLNKWLAAAVIAAPLAALFLLSSRPDAPASSEVKPSTVKPFELPQNLDFAGEALPLNRLDVQEKLDRELLVNTYWQSNNLLMLKRSAKYFPIIEPILRREGIPSDFKYLALIESGLQNVVSPAGAAGMWQIMPATGKEHGLEIYSEVDERYHLVKSTEVACAYLKEAYERLGSWTLAAASYNMGMAGASRRLEEQRVDNYYDLWLNAETARYVYRIAAIKHIHENLEKFGYVYNPGEGYRLPKFDTIVVTETVDSWVDWAIAHGTTYSELRTYNPWIRADRLMVTNNTYEIWVPKK